MGLAELQGRCSATAGSRVSLAAALLALLAATSGCMVKKTLNVPVPAGLRAAKTASLDELLSVLADYGDNIEALASSSLKATYTSGKVESGKLQAYRSAPGYILLKRPDSILLNIQNPVTKTTLFELVSIGDPFSIWYPREDKIFVGRNSMKEIEVEGHPDLTLKPAHILQAILPRKIDQSAPGLYISPEEEQDAITKYYVLSVFRADGDRILHPVRRLWIDRSILAVTRQEMFDDAGRIVSNVSYSRLTPSGKWLMPLSIKIDRPEDGYSLDLEFRDWRVNPALPQNAFEFRAPEGAQRVELKEKGRSG